MNSQQGSAAGARRPSGPESFAGARQLELDEQLGRLRGMMRGRAEAAARRANTGADGAAIDAVLTAFDTVIDGFRVEQVGRIVEQSDKVGTPDHPAYDRRVALSTQALLEPQAAWVQEVTDQQRQVLAGMESGTAAAAMLREVLGNDAVSGLGSTGGPDSLAP